MTAITQAELFFAAAAIETELMRQYRASKWEEAKDVLEGIDYCRLVRATSHILPESDQETT